MLWFKRPHIVSTCMSSKEAHPYGPRWPFCCCCCCCSKCSFPVFYLNWPYFIRKHLLMPWNLIKCPIVLSYNITHFSLTAGITAAIFCELSYELLTKECRLIWLGSLRTQEIMFCFVHYCVLSAMLMLYLPVSRNVSNTCTGISFLL